MNIKLTGITNDILQGVYILSENLGCTVTSDGAEIKVSKCDKGFSLSVKNNAAEIKYERLNDFFRALAITVDALKKGEDKELSQVYNFDTCGVMIDCSRRAVLKPETVKMLMRYMSLMGLNRMMLYTEDTYEIEGYPYFGYMRGRYTKSEIKDIVAYGNTLGIETVPCIQTLAHLERAMRWNAFSEVRTASDTLLVGEEKTYDFIEEMIKTCRECYTTDAIHIGMDEAYNTNLGAYLNKNGYEDKLAVICKHLKRVADIVAKYNFKPMIWGDMFLRRINASEDQKTLPTELRDMIPQGVNMVFWSYEGRSEDTYDFRFTQMAQTNNEVSFAGGIHTWEGPNVNYNISFESSICSLRSCKRSGIKDVFATMWGDQGCECDVTEALLGFQLYAECNYTSLYMDKTVVPAMFKICTGMDAESFLALDSDNYYGRECPPEIEKYELNIEKYPVKSPTKQSLYQNPMFGLLDKNFESVDLASHFAKECEKFANTKIPKGFEALFAYHKQLLKVVASKCDIGLRIKKAFDADDRKTLAALVSELTVLSVEIQKLYDARAKLWYENNKPFGFEQVGSRIMAVRGLVINAYTRISSYLAGDVETLPELCEERLYYNSEEMPFVGDYVADNIMIP